MQLTHRLHRHMLAKPKAKDNIIEQRDEFFAYMFILRSELEMGMYDAADELMAAAKGTLYNTACLN